METTCLLIDAIAIALVLYFSRTNDKLKEGEQQAGYFRFVTTVAPKPNPNDRVRGRGFR